MRWARARTLRNLDTYFEVHNYFVFPSFFYLYVSDVTFVIVDGLACDIQARALIFPFFLLCMYVDAKHAMNTFFCAVLGTKSLTSL